MAADRAINMALRVLGIGEVERDFRRVGDAGSKSFAQVEKSANGATREVSEYTARLKLVAAQLKQVAANIPELSKGTPDQIKANRRDFMLTGIQAAKDRFMKDAVSGLDAGTVAAGRFSGALGVASAAGVAAGISFSGMAFAVQQSLAAYSDHEKAISAFSASLALGGNRSTATGAQIRAMAEEIAASTGQTEEAALQAAVALAKIPGMTKEGLQAALEASARLADSLGTDVASVITGQVAPAFQALADRDMKGLLTATQELNPELRLTVLRLAEAGKTAEAQQALVAGLAQAAGDGPGGLTSATSQASGAWTRLKQTFGEEFSGPAVTALSAVTFALDGLRSLTESVSGRWIKMIGLLSNPVTLPVGLVELFRGKKPGAAAENPDPYGTGALFSAGAAAVAAAQVKQLEDKYNAKPARSRG
ncbi:MAG: hypothetical protein FP826_09265, partial [Sphingomonadales bacterium]|nr:hypothetical protein [Sphingomonadales bacterium]MBU3991572.1 hypothetical protein [Alphaproteobacteria bacterium]